MLAGQTRGTDIYGVFLMVLLTESFTYGYPVEDWVVEVVGTREAEVLSRGSSKFAKGIVSGEIGFSLWRVIAMDTAIVSGNGCVHLVLKMGMGFPLFWG